MLKIRLQRVGKKHQPFYRLVLIDSRRAASSGSFLDILGSYDVLKKRVQADEEKIKNWMNKGVKISDTVYNLLIKEKIIEGKKRIIKIGKKKPEQAQQAETVEKPAELETNNNTSENV
jgi:small subunit ribosomal protein S16